MTENAPKVIRDTDEEARALARLLISTAPFAAIAVLDPVTFYPNSSRVLTATDSGGYPVILVSGLSAHTRALTASAKCSLLMGEPGKGDPLAWPRLSLQCDAQKIAHDDPERSHIRARFLRRHKKAALYADFPDFMFFRLVPVSASLNGGFGRAYQLTPQDVTLPPDLPKLQEEQEKNLIAAVENTLKKSADDGTSVLKFRIVNVNADGIVFERKGLKNNIFISYDIGNMDDINLAAQEIYQKFLLY